MKEQIERQAIEEMAKVIDEYTEPLSSRDIHKAEFSEQFAEALYSAGYRKQSEGEWRDYSDKYDRGMDLRCSVCGKRASSFVGGTEDWWDHYEPNYCPNCGAKMKGGAE